MQPSELTVNLKIHCRMFVLESEEAAKRMAELHATSEKELMFTTYRCSVAFKETP